MEGYDTGTYGRSFADVYDDWYADISDVEATVERIADLAGPGGRVLELGVGTGRLAVPLAARGLAVTGVDSSAEMLERLAAKDGAAAVEAVLGDMADPPVTGPFAVAFAAVNTLFNLTTREAQQACLARAAHLLEPAGALIVEAFVPPDPTTGSHSGVSVRAVEVDRVVLTATRRDPASQQVAGQHIEITDAGVRLRPWCIRYATPAELDEMARGAGLTLASRHADWRAQPFDDHSPVHVSTYRRAD